MKQPAVQFRQGSGPALPSLLADWINAQAEPLVQEVRGARRKGEMVPFSLQKTFAAWLMLTSRPLRMIAQDAKTSVGVLKMWRTEPRFRKAVRSYTGAFADYFVQQGIGPRPMIDVPGLYNAETVKAIRARIDSVERADPTTTALVRGAMHLTLARLVGDRDLHEVLKAQGHVLICRAAREDLALGTEAGRQAAADMLATLEDSLTQTAAEMAKPAVRKGPRKGR